MAEVTDREMDATIRGYLSRVIGQVCSRQHIGKDRSLNLGFGAVVRRKSAIAEADHGTWQIGTYTSSWRIVYGRQVVCGSQDAVDDVEEMRQKISEMQWGRLAAIRQLNELDVRVELDNGVIVDFLATISDDDEIVHVFFPEKEVVEFSIVGGWTSGPSDKPWPARP